MDEIIMKKLVDYIIENENKGFSHEDITEALIKVGYSEDDIHDAFVLADDMRNPHEVRFFGTKDFPKSNEWVELLFSLLTFGIYYLYWLYRMKKDWAILIPVFNIAPLYHLAMDLEDIVEMHHVMIFFMMSLFPFSSILYVQYMINKA